MRGCQTANGGFHQIGHSAGCSCFWWLCKPALQTLVQVCRCGLWTTHGSTLDQGTFSTDALAAVQQYLLGEKFAAGLHPSHHPLHNGTHLCCARDAFETTQGASEAQGPKQQVSRGQSKRIGVEQERGGSVIRRFSAVRLSLHPCASPHSCLAYSVAYAQCQATSARHRVKSFGFTCTQAQEELRWSGLTGRWPVTMPRPPSACAVLFGKAQGPCHPFHGTAGAAGGDACLC